MSEIFTFIGSVLEHEGFIAVYGVVAWFGLHYALDKKKNSKIIFKKWRKDHSSDILITVIIALGMVIFDDEIVDAYNDFAENDIELQRWFYFLPGVVTGRILKWVYKEEKETAV